MPGCGGDESREAGKKTPTNTTTTTETSTASKDVSEPVIDGRFAVGADGHELAMLRLGEGWFSDHHPGGRQRFLRHRAVRRRYRSAGGADTDLRVRPRGDGATRPTERRRTLDESSPTCTTPRRGQGPLTVSPCGPVGRRQYRPFTTRAATGSGSRASSCLTFHPRPGTSAKSSRGPLGWRNPEHLDWVDADRRGARRLLPLGDVPLWSSLPQLASRA
jgi:hypothetical protein